MKSGAITIIRLIDGLIFTSIPIEIDNIKSMIEIEITNPKQEE